MVSETLREEPGSELSSNLQNRHELKELFSYGLGHGIACPVGSNPTGHVFEQHHERVLRRLAKGLGFVPPGERSLKIKFREWNNRAP